MGPVFPNDRAVGIIILFENYHLCDVRIAQIERMIELVDQLYPRMRVYLYDARMIYSSPMTVFGPQLAVLVLGSKLYGLSR